MTMNVLATTLAPATAKAAGKGKQGSGEGVDFAALLDSSAPGVADLAKLLTNGKGKPRGKEAADALALLAAAQAALTGKTSVLSPGEGTTEHDGATDGTTTADPALNDADGLILNDAALAAAALALAMRSDTTRTTASDDGMQTSATAVTGAAQPATTAMEGTTTEGAAAPAPSDLSDDGTPLPNDIAQLIEKLVKGDGKAGDAPVSGADAATKEKPTPTPSASEQGVAHAAASSAVARAQGGAAKEENQADASAISRASATGMGATASANGQESRNDGERERDTGSDSRHPAAGSGTTIAATATGAQQSFSQTVSTIATTGAVGAALNQQVVDMGVSGQWLDSIAQQISAVAQSGGHGRFTVDAAHLGPVQVQVTPGDQGTHVHLTVQTESALQALNQDSDRLIREAQLSSVRIAELRVDRAPQVAEAQRSDMSGQSQQQGHGQGQSSANMTQFAFNQQGQGGQRGAFAAQDFGQQGSGQQNGQRGVKDNGGAAVINQQGPSSADASGESRRARYA